MFPYPVRPHCQPGQQSAYGASRNEVVTVRCAVDAHPASDLIFRWMFNSTMEVTEVANSTVSTSGWQSNVTHRIQNEQDYGTLLCWARNAIGEQREPCIFTIQPAGKISYSSMWNTLVNVRQCVIKTLNIGKPQASRRRRTTAPRTTSQPAGYPSVACQAMMAACRSFSICKCSKPRPTTRPFSMLLASNRATLVFTLWNLEQLTNCTFGQKTQKVEVRPLSSWLKRKFHIKMSATPETLITSLVVLVVQKECWPSCGTSCWTCRSDNSSRRLPHDAYTWGFDWYRRYAHHRGRRHCLHC